VVFAEGDGLTRKSSLIFKLFILRKLGDINFSEKFLTSMKNVKFFLIFDSEIEQTG
jgi:hypothetical protein